MSERQHHWLSAPGVSALSYNWMLARVTKRLPPLRSDNVSCSYATVVLQWRSCGAYALCRLCVGHYPERHLLRPTYSSHQPQAAKKQCHGVREFAHLGACAARLILCSQRDSTFNEIMHGCMASGQLLRNQADQSEGRTSKDVLERAQEAVFWQRRQPRNVTSHALVTFVQGLLPCWVEAAVQLEV